MYIVSLCTVALIHVTSKINMNIKVFFKKKTKKNGIRPLFFSSITSITSLTSIRLQLLQQLLHRCDAKLLSVGFALESHVYDAVNRAESRAR